MIPREKVKQLQKSSNDLEDYIKNKYNGDLIATICVGSYAYGLETPKSDLDMIGIHSVSLRDLLKINAITESSTKSTVELQTQSYENVEVISHEISKFCYLCTKCNPNVLEVLFIDENMIIKNTDIFSNLRKNRHKLISTSKIISSYVGYADSQFSRMPNDELKEQLNKISGDKWSSNLFNFEKGLKFIYDNAKITDSMNYNYKNAMHGIRILYSLTYFLQNNEILVDFNKYIPDIGTAIRDGNFDFKTIMWMAYEEIKKIKSLENNIKNENYDVDFINNFIYDLRISNYNKKLGEK